MPRKKKDKQEIDKKPDETKVEQLTRMLRVVLTRDEVEERADRAAHLLSERDAKQEMAKAAAKQMKSEIEALEAQLREVSTQVRDKACYRETVCERVFNYTAATVTVRRLDTHEVIEERAMTTSERQMGLDLDDEAKGLEDDFNEDEPQAAE